MKVTLAETWFVQKQTNIHNDNNIMFLLNKAHKKHK